MAQPGQMNNPQFMQQYLQAQSNQQAPVNVQTHQAVVSQQKIQPSPYGMMGQQASLLQSQN